MANSWKTRDFTEIPAAVQSNMAQVKVEEHMISVPVDGASVDVFYREVKGQEYEVKIPLLLLHGASFKSQTWLELGTLSLLGAMGYRAVAMDLPGFGNTKGTAIGDRGKFLQSFIEAVDLDRPVVVSPSMSGGYSLPFLLSDPTKAGSKARGYVPVAPVSTGMYQPDQYNAMTVPTLIIYGSNDKGIGQQSVKDLSHVPNKEVVVFADCGHACYMNNPKLWHQMIYNFMDILQHP